MEWDKMPVGRLTQGMFGFPKKVVSLEHGITCKGVRNSLRFLLDSWGQNSEFALGVRWAHFVIECRINYATNHEEGIRIFFGHSA